GSDPDASRFQRRVRSAVDDDAAVPGEAAPVAMPPDARVSLEIAHTIFRTVRVIPEADRHRRKRRLADELTRLVAKRVAFRSEDSEVHAEAWHLDLATQDGKIRTSPRKEPDDVRTAGDRGQMDIRLDRPVDEVEAFGRERRSGRRDRPDRGEIVRLDRFQTGL